MAGNKNSGLPKGRTNNPAGRPKRTAGLAPKKSPAKRTPKSQATPEDLTIFDDRKQTETWARKRLARQVFDYDFVIDELRDDLKANSLLIRACRANKTQPTQEVMRTRQSIIASMKTLMSGNQELIVSLIKTRNLLGNLNDEEEGGDVLLNVQRLPARQSRPSSVSDDAPAAAPTEGAESAPSE